MKPDKLQSGLAVLIAACALALPAAAGAEETKTLYKCVDAKGVVSIQAKSCPAGSTQAWTRPAQTEKQTPEQLQAARDREKRSQQQVLELSAEVNRKMAERDAAEQGTVVPVTTSQAPTEPARLQMAGPQPPTPDAPDPSDIQAAATNHCAQAQNFMAAVREKTWIGITDDQMKRIYSWVIDQCRVNTAAAK